MHPQIFAEVAPQKPAIIEQSSGKTVTYSELNAGSNRIAHLIRSIGLVRGDTIAILFDNRADFFEIVWAAQRSGLYFTCLSTRLTVEEADYIISDSGAKAIFASATQSEVAQSLSIAQRKFSSGGSIPGYQNLEQVVAQFPETPIGDESPGCDMLYSSGTTGRPKGIKATLPSGGIDRAGPLDAMLRSYGFSDDTVYLSPAPLYHAAPMRTCMSVHRFGGTVVLMEKFDPELTLQFIEKYRVTHAQFVPTMFVRLLKLPAAIREKYDTSSLQVAIHAAAPCPVEIKSQMMDWWGPILYEYYSGTEGVGATSIGPKEWLQKPGSVGRAAVGRITIVDDNDNVLPAGEPGRIYFADGPTFEYHNDPEKTRGVSGKHGATIGDIGYLDVDGYLYLTDRASYMIISGGVNIYPQEAENTLILHPKVADVAVLGIPNEDLGEEVKAVVQLHDWNEASDALATELVEFCRSRISAIKCPRSVDFIRELPRHDTGKLFKRQLRDQYWPAAK